MICGRIESLFGESTIPLFVAVNYQLLAVMLLKYPKLATLSCCRPETATSNGVRDRRSNWLKVKPRPSQFSTSWAHLHCKYLWILCRESNLNHSADEARALPMQPHRLLDYNAWGEYIGHLQANSGWLYL